MTPDFKAAVERNLGQSVAGPLRGAATALSGRYRAGGTSAGIDLAAYLTVRLPATFASVSYVMAEVAHCRPGFSPTSLLDAGTGPGTAAWAAAERWPGLERVTLLDHDPDFLALASRLACRSPHPALNMAHALKGDIAGALPEADLVTAAYALAEVPIARQKAALAALWRAARQMLILVEPGTPDGFARIRAARGLLLEEGAVPLAPCTHAAACPMASVDWCHFSVRLSRSRAHMHAKQANVPFEDEKFSYLAVARSGSETSGARILSPPRAQKSGTIFKLCTVDGLEMRNIATRDSAAYKAQRKKQWGDVL